MKLFTSLQPRDPPMAGRQQQVNQNPVCTCVTTDLLLLPLFTQYDGSLWYIIAEENERKHMLGREARTNGPRAKTM